MLLNSSIYIEDLDAASRSILQWDKLKGKSILITGACGLICSCLVDIIMYRNEHFGDDINVYALCRGWEASENRFPSYFSSGLFNVVNQDVCDEINLDAGVDYIIHGASHAHPVAFANDPVGTMMTNFYGMHNILQFARKNNCCRVLFISSGEVYGEMSGSMAPFAEAYSGHVDPMDVRSCYPSSKRAAETLCVSFANQYDVDVVVARPSHVYGPNMKNTDSRAIASFIRDAAAGRDIVMKSQGTQVRGYCYVVDAASAILTIMFSGKCCDAYNVSDRKSVISVRDMARLVAECGNTKLVVSEPSELEKTGYTPVMRQVLDSTKLEALGWTARTHIKDGISKTLNIFKEVSGHK